MSSASALQVMQDLNKVQKRTVNEMRRLIVSLEDAMLKDPCHAEAKDFETYHHFQPGIYIRELRIPKQTLLTGRIHVFSHLNILSQGKITVWTENGMKTFTASTVLESKVGIKRVGFTHEDSVWITVHKNEGDSQNIGEIEDRLFANDFTEAYLKSNRKFSDAIQFLGLSSEEVKTISENEEDQIPFPQGSFGVELKKSTIHGYGLFATQNFQKGQFIAMARILNKRTPAGRYCNHSGDPNSAMTLMENGNVSLDAIKQIKPGDEILNDYYISFTETRTLELMEQRKDLLCQP